MNMTHTTLPQLTVGKWTKREQIILHVGRGEATIANLRYDLDEDAVALAETMVSGGQHAETGPNSTVDLPTIRLTHDGRDRYDELMDYWAEGQWDR